MKLGYAWMEYSGQDKCLRRDVRLEWLSEMTGREILTTGAITEEMTAWNTLSNYEIKAILVMLETFPQEIIEWLKELTEIMKTARVTEVTLEQPFKEGTIDAQRLANSLEKALDPKKIVICRNHLLIHLSVKDDSKEAQNDIKKKINQLMRDELRLYRGVTIEEAPCLEKEPV